MIVRARAPSKSMRMNNEKNQESTTISKAFVKLYIKDVLDLALEATAENVFQYNGHLIYKVNIFGIIVKVSERPKFFLYGVDDGTGVINCCCWKPTPEPQPFSIYGDVESLSIEDFLKLKISDNLVQQMSPLELGESIHVRGRVKTYRGDLQVSASFFEKVDDPRCEREIVRMLELPRLYKEVYDKQFMLKEAENSKTKPLVPEKLVIAVQQFLQNSATNSFYIAELETVDHLMDITKELSLFTEESATTSCQVLSTSATKRPSITTDAAIGSSSVLTSLPNLSSSTSTLSATVDAAIGSSKSSASSSTSRPSAIVVQARSSCTSKASFMLKEVVHQLEQRGLVYKSDSVKDLYYVVHDKMSIAGEVLKTLSNLCSKTKNLKGCHYLQLLKNLQQKKQFNKVTESTLLQVLQKLEENSDVISTTNEHYIPFRI